VSTIVELSKSTKGFRDAILRAFVGGIIQKT